MQAALRLGAVVALLAATIPSLAAGQSGPAMAGPAAAGPAMVPGFTIWDVKLGQPVSAIPDPEIVNVACGTNGGPPALALKNFSEFAKCQPEASGLREVHFEYDDEQAYVAKALELEYRFLTTGTSVYAHPVNVSVLVDDKGIARGIRIVTDDRASIRDRRSAASLEQSLRARFADWSLDCKALPPADGEDSVGGEFVHDICTGQNAASDRLRIESVYMRRKGQVAIDPETQKLIRDSFYSSTRFEEVEAPYQPQLPPTG